MQNLQVGGIHVCNRHGNFNRFFGLDFLVDIGIRQGDVHRADLTGFCADCFFHDISNLFRLDGNSGDFRVFRNGPGGNFNLQISLFQLDLLFVDSDRCQSHVLFNGGFRSDILALCAVEPAVQMLFPFRMIREFADRLTAAAGTGLAPVGILCFLLPANQPGEESAEYIRRLR